MAKSKKRGMERVSYEQIEKDWLLMTGKHVSHCHLRGLEYLYKQFHDVLIMCVQDFERLKTTWLHLTGIMNLNNFDKLKQKYLLMNQSRMNSSDFVILRKYWMWLSEIKKPNNSETLKRDYLVLNFSQMSDEDYTRLKTNWQILTERLGIDNQENIIKGWFRNDYPYYNEYYCIPEKCKIEITRFYLERGVDVNYHSACRQTLLHMITSNHLMLNKAVVKLLMSYGADVTIRAQNDLTPLDEVRIFHYKGSDDIVHLLQEAEKSMRKSVLRNKAKQTPRLSSEMLSTNIQNNTQSHFKTKRNVTKQLSIQTYGSIYLKIMINLFSRVNLDGVGDLLLIVINAMFISNTLRIYLDYQDTSRLDNIMRIHQIYCQMCTKLFNVFDLHFNQRIDITFPSNAKLCENAELVLSVEIHPELEWVALKLFADPSEMTESRYSMEYYILCVANSRSRCILCRKYWDNSTKHSDNLIYKYKRYFSPEQQNRLLKYSNPQYFFNNIEI